MTIPTDLLIPGVALIGIVAATLLWIWTVKRIIRGVRSMYDTYGMTSYKQYRRDKIYSQRHHIEKIIADARDIAYSKIWESEMAKYAASGYKLGNEDMSRHRTQFVRHVLGFCGPSIQQDLVLLHGDMDSTVMALITWFDSRLNSDEQTLLSYSLRGDRSVDPNE